MNADGADREFIICALRVLGPPAVESVEVRCVECGAGLWLSVLSIELATAAGKAPEPICGACMTVLAKDDEVVMGDLPGHKEALGLIGMMSPEEYETKRMVMRRWFEGQRR